MRLFEIVSPAFYLCTDHKQAISETIERQASVYPLGATLEGRLEHRRPEDALPRSESFYLHLAPCGDAPFVYLVEPIGQIDRHHSAWLSVLKDANLASDGEVDHAVCAYWSGKEQPEARDEPWEYRALKVKVLGRVGGFGLNRSS